VRDRFDLDGDNRLLLFVGRLVPVKNPAGALGVVEALPETHHLLIVGEGPERSTLQQLANERGLTDRVRFLGELPHDETLEMIAAADVLVVTSDIESYGTAALEALALSIPVASTPVGVLTEIDHDRVSLASIEDLPRVLESMDRLGTDELDEYVLEQYSMARYTDTILEAFAELVSLGTVEHNERRH
jgi:glycosyltransferase involved in cell wall biosynthesis